MVSNIITQRILRIIQTLDFLNVRIGNYNIYQVQNIHELGVHQR